MPIAAADVGHELGVEQPPDMAVAVFADPVILQIMRREVVGKADAQPRRNAVRCAGSSRRSAHSRGRRRTAGARILRGICSERRSRAISTCRNSATERRCASPREVSGIDNAARGGLLRMQHKSADDRRQLGRRLQEGCRIRVRRAARGRSSGCARIRRRTRTLHRLSRGTAETATVTENFQVLSNAGARCARHFAHDCGARCSLG